jgi:DNA-binding NarL/FixJ family response regulator
MSGPRKYRVFIVGNHPVCRHGMAQIVNAEPDLVVCGEAAVSAAAATGAQQAAADLLLVDFIRTDSAGRPLLQQAREEVPTLGILVVSSEPDAEYALTLLQAGARGYLLKTEGLSDFLTAIRKVLAGEVYLNRSFGDRLISQLARGQKEARTGGTSLERLTAREREVLRLFGSGLSNKQVAAKLHLSPKTVETHRLHIKEKLGVESTAELLHFAVTQFKEAGGEGP